mmetsp:Transcript_44744/g.97307  ORF Transcript_44744/g.97307 Transcript_44744/m.97307 type:complete len:261 (-) Transcript_44744:404-1186(-)
MVPQGSKQLLVAAADERHHTFLVQELGTLLIDLLGILGVEHHDQRTARHHASWPVVLPGALHGEGDLGLHRAQRQSVGLQRLLLLRLPADGKISIIRPDSRQRQPRRKSRNRRRPDLGQRLPVDARWEDGWFHCGLLADLKRHIAVALERPGSWRLPLGSLEISSGQRVLDASQLGTGGLLGCLLLYLIVRGLLLLLCLGRIHQLAHLLHNALLQYSEVLRGRRPHPNSSDSGKEGLNHRGSGISRTSESGKRKNQENKN